MSRKKLYVTSYLDDINGGHEELIGIFSSYKEADKAGVRFIRENKEKACEEDILLYAVYLDEYYYGTWVYLS